jgi:Domain of unknown function (DUF5615)
VKRVLFDENMPRRLRRELRSVEVRTVQEEGWAGMKNGALLSKAQGTFDVLLTGDQRLQFQQNIPAFDIAVVIIASRSLRFRDSSLWLQESNRRWNRRSRGW